MIYNRLNVRTVLVAFFSAPLLAGYATAQTTPPAKPAGVSPVPYTSAFEGYQAHSDDKMTNWKAANDEVARIGGWREYAKQAQQPEDTPTKAGEFKPKASP